MSQEISLQQCEAIIKEGLESINKVNRAFSIIKTMHLYEGEYKNFDTYCQLKWNAQDMCQDLKTINLYKEKI